MAGQWLRSVLVLRGGALGDAVLTLPLLRALQRGGVDRLTILGNERVSRRNSSTIVGFVNISDISTRKRERNHPSLARCRPSGHFANFFARKVS